ncbi:ImmA/IrrE family metallo-endopeptidase [Sphingobacterium faecium]|uniref:ImmA/IrrE family metallo-endopeptidase n=1 Tax=Sphingobacterium faecium TaxID=34087 RepID=UPI0021B52802|nr:ImmA/IrrE family metallo-endopeptidase [Sphingobacterium faecium]UXD71079.1 ImmA/IrrE family metallo-endopeptidase [Sphingobacterium faecium]
MLDLRLLGKKLLGCRSRLEYSMCEVVNGTGINQKRLIDLENGLLEPTGDEILILADFFKEDYKFFISNQQSSASENTEILYRQFGNEFSKEDRRRIQEFLYLCECEADIWELLKKNKKIYNLPPRIQSPSREADEIATAIRTFLGYNNEDLLQNIFDDFRKLGLHIFRRELTNSNISGLFIQHPIAGKCILINYSEDLYRQNFTLAHEVAHSIFDTNATYNVSFSKTGDDLKERRANRFAASFLMPERGIKKFTISKWTDQLLIELAKQFRVSIIALLYRLLSLKLLNKTEFEFFKKLKLSHSLKEDPELKGLSEKIIIAKSEILKKGLSTTYVRECHEAYANSIISQSRLAEMLLIPEEELRDLLALFNLKLIYEF